MDNKLSIEFSKPSAEVPAHFEFSIEKPPSLEMLREYIYLAHATNSFPANDILYAQARDNTQDKMYGDSKIPSFRPTLHFSMGELLKGGWEGGLI
jgi:hypothetical protein